MPLTAAHRHRLGSRGSASSVNSERRSSSSHAEGYRIRAIETLTRSFSLPRNPRRADSNQICAITQARHFHPDTDTDRLASGLVAVGPLNDCSGVGAGTCFHGALAFLRRR